MSDLQPHQQRMIAECEELETRINALEVFTAGAMFQTLPDAEKDDLADQLRAMWAYLDALSSRIARFKGAQP